MNGVLVDSNVILDIFTDNSSWYEWSFTKLEYYKQRYPLFINKIIYAEISMSYKTMDDITAIVSAEFKQSLIPLEAAFLAGKAYKKYRQSGGDKIRPLPDFFIGAHAVVNDYLLLTRDKGYKHYFSNIHLVTPIAANDSTY